MKKNVKRVVYTNLHYEWRQCGMLVCVIEFIFKIKNFIAPQYNIRFFIIL